MVERGADDREEFTRWARARQGHLLRVALLMTDDVGRAEDLVQDALTQVAMRWQVSRIVGWRPGEQTVVSSYARLSPEECCTG